MSLLDNLCSKMTLTLLFSYLPEFYHHYEIMQWKQHLKFI